jgi:Mor family transcriptional regulator
MAYKLVKFIVMSNKKKQLSHTAAESQKQRFDPLGANIDDILAHLDNVDHDDSRAWPQTLANLVDVFTDHFQRRKGHSNEAAHMEARDLIVVLANYFGGRQVYLPRDEKLRLALRDNLIWRDFDGRNFDVLEKRWQLTRQQIYNIIAHQRVLHKKRAQQRNQAYMSMHAR